ncbi:hypothetical protein NL108_017327 [Boleophthalmus pectinirostris]|uniref:UPF0538 protein C2orf76 homolog n=1 Tax=Boleophthalmus pectinirostris TaxID=150288 RepID=UPI000A1C5A9E|nr:UPF0538 protein C2orf76 homolog [Boleophthalmus pectinirostris]KAJ0070653.1 hypothetical protein NL108_017327 [Boleophthalmus pectinirostris]
MCEEPGDTCAGPGVTLTVRLVRSFEYRNFRPVVFQRVRLEQSVREFTERVRQEIETKPGLPPPFRKYQYDTMKIIHQAHGAKTNDLVMSLDDQDKPLLQENQTLQEAGVTNETELAFFKKSDYDAFKANPQVAW